jgi:hypothetical protein
MGHRLRALLLAALALPLAGLPAGLLAGAAPAPAQEQVMHGITLVVGEERTLAQGWRIPPGARLVVDRATLVFPPGAGIVAEAGSDLRILGSVVQGEVRASGESSVEGSAILGTLALPNGGFVRHSAVEAIEAGGTTRIEDSGVGSVACDGSAALTIVRGATGRGGGPALDCGGASTVALHGAAFAGPGQGVRLRGNATLDATDAEFQGLDPALRVDEAARAILRGGRVALASGTGLDAAGPAALDGVAFVGPGRCAVLGGEGQRIVASTFDACTTGVLLDGARDAVLRGNSFEGTADPLRVAGAERAAFAHQVEGNTVDGLALAWVVGARGVELRGAVGHAVVAHSAEVTLQDLDLRHGRAHVVRSEDVRLAAPVGGMGALAHGLGPEVAAAWAQVGPGVRFEPSPGAMRGPQGALDEGAGSAWDQAWALAALLRAGGREARLVEGALLVPEQALLAWAGIASLEEVRCMAAFAGASQEGASWRVPHAWVEVAVGEGGWAALDPAYEMATRAPPRNLTLLGLEAARPFAAALRGAQVDEANGTVRGLDLDAAVAAQRGGRVALALGGVPARDLLGDQGSRPPAPWEEPVQRIAQRRHMELPPEQQWSVRIAVRAAGSGPEELAWEAPLPSLYGQPIVLASAPADAAAAARLADGGVYAPGGGQQRVVPLLAVNGSTVAVGAARLPGEAFEVVVQPRLPGNGTHYTKVSPLRAGGTYAIALEVGRTTPALAVRLGQALEQQAARAARGEMVPLHDLVGRLDHLRGHFFLAHLRGATDPLARSLDVLALPTVSVVITGQAPQPTRTNGAAGVAPGPPSLDVRQSEHFHATDGQARREQAYLLGVAIHGSNLEDKTIAGLHGLPAAGTVKALALANQQGAALLHLNASSALGRFPRLAALPQDAQEGIAEAIATRGRDVVAPTALVRHHDYEGVVWADWSRQTARSNWMLFGRTDPPGPMEAAGATILFGGLGAAWQPLAAQPPEPWDRGVPLGPGGIAWANGGISALLDLDAARPQALPSGAVVHVPVTGPRELVAAQAFQDHAERSAVLLQRSAAHAQGWYDPPGRGMGDAAGAALVAADVAAIAHAARLMLGHDALPGQGSSAAAIAGAVVGGVLAAEATGALLER